MLPDGGAPEDDDEEADSGADPSSAPDQAATSHASRRQVGEEFLEIFEEEPDEEIVEWALGSEFLESEAAMAYKESYAVFGDGIRHVVFETNHSDLNVADGDANETAIVHQIARFTRQYANRWGIENGYKIIKSFMTETTSTDHSYRFFNFIFACLLYSLWRLVDVLVKRSLVAERAETRVDVPDHRQTGIRTRSARITA